MKTRRNFNRPCRHETLEDRRLLTVFNPPPFPGTPVIVAPPNGFAPILLPPGTATPPGTTQQPAPLPGQLPPGLPQIVGSAEQIALNSFATFQAAHPKGKLKITDNLSKSGVFTLTISETDGKKNSFTETITETSSGVAVTLNVIDGTHQEILGAAQSTTGAMNAALADLVFESNRLTSSVLESQINGTVMVRQS